MRLRRRHHDSLRNAGWRPTALLLSILVAVAVGACGGGDGDSAADPSGSAGADASDATTTVPETTTTTSANQGKYGFEPVHTWTWTTRTPNGYEQSATLSVGSPSRVADAPTLPGYAPAETAAAGCSGYGGNTTAVLPAALELTNSTDGFAHKLSQTLYRGFRPGQSQATSRMLVARKYSSGVECSEISTYGDAFYSQGSGWGLSYDAPTAAGASERPHLAYLLILDYFSPAHPDGNPAFLDDALLVVVPNMSNDQRKLVAFSGSGIEPDYLSKSKGFVETAAIPLDGTLPAPR